MPDHISVDESQFPGNMSLRCCICGEIRDIQFPVSGRYLIQIASQFRREHEKCVRAMCEGEVDDA